MTNYSLYSVPAAWLLCFVPHVYAIYIHDTFSSGSKFDNTKPRSLTSTICNDQTLSQATRDTIIRAEGAQQNGFENIGLYAAAIVAANVAGVQVATLNALSAAYVASRVLYNFVYVNNRTEMLAGLRTFAFSIGAGVVVTLFIMAGKAVNL